MENSTRHRLNTFQVEGMSTNQITLKDNPENQRIIQEWLKRNNSGRVVIGPNNLEVNSQNIMENGKKPYPIIVSVTKKNNENLKRCSLPPNKGINTKRNSIQPGGVKTKIARWSSPAVSIKIEPVVPKSEKKESHFEPETSTPLKRDPKPVLPLKHLKDKLPASENLKKVSLPTIKATRNVKNHTIKKKNTPNLQIKDDQDVYNSVKDNYKHLSTPKYWSVIEFESDSFKQCIVFSKPHIINENEKLITVIQRSLIIDKGGTIHYSVYGLPVNVKGTILPDNLDNIKKLLSILHIFDKMQVCRGLGDNLLIVKTDCVVQDVCQIWRHADCKLVLIKTDQCQPCLDARNALLEKELLFKSEVLTMHCVEDTIKQEQT